MINDRPIDDPQLQRCLDDVKQVLTRYGFAGACMIISAEEAAFFYKMHAPWSALRYDNATPLGFRFRAQSHADGKKVTECRVEAALHTICQMSDFGSQTMDWMEQLKALLRKQGIEFDHTPFNGAPLPSLRF